MSAEPDSPARRLRILFIARYYYWWDQPRAGMLHLAMSPLGLRARGHDVRFVCERRGEQQFDDDGMDVRAFRLTPDLTPSRLEQLGMARVRALRSVLTRVGYLNFLRGAYSRSIEVCRDWTPDIVYCQAESPAPAAARVARRVGAPWIVHTYGGALIRPSDLANWNWRARHNLDLLYAYRADADAYFMVDDGSQGDRVAGLLGVPRSKVHFWPIPVAEPSRGRPMYSWRSRLGISPSATIMIAVGRLVRHKRLDLCLLHGSTALERNRGAHLVLVGDGPERRSLESMRASLSSDVRQRVHLVGSLARDDLSHLLQEASVFLSLQEESVSGTNLRDALMHGLCVVAVRRHGDVAVGTLVESGSNGILIDESDIDTTGNLLDELLRDHERQRRLGDLARKIAISSFDTWPRRIDAEERLLLDLATKRKDTAP